MHYNVGGDSCPGFESTMSDKGSTDPTSIAQQSTEPLDPQPQPQQQHYLSDPDPQMSGLAAESLPPGPASSQQAVASSQQAVASSQQAVASSQQAVASSQQAVASSQQAVASFQQAVASQQGIGASIGMQGVGSEAPVHQAAVGESTRYYDVYVCACLILVGCFSCL